MPAWKTEPIVADPPMEQWEMFNLPWQSTVSRIDGINMPKLKTLYCDGQYFLSTLPWGDLPNLESLSVYSCGFATLELWRLSQLRSCMASENQNLVAVDAHDVTTLTSMDLYFCPMLASIHVQGCTGLRYLYAMGCALSQQMIDQILTDLVSNGATSGYVDLRTEPNQAPSEPYGITQKNILIGRGWTVSTN